MSSAASRQRRHRERQRRDIMCLKIEVPHVDLTYALELAGLLSPELLDNRSAIARSVEDLLAEWMSRVTRGPI
jgi:hypothetical protein